MAETVKALLQPMQAEEVRKFHERLIAHVTENHEPFKVVHDVGDGKGKGVVACQAIRSGCRILAEAPLVSFVLLTVTHAARTSDVAPGFMLWPVSRVCTLIANVCADSPATCMQVGEQHVANRQHALICDHCFRYIGPLELQLGFRLLSVAEQAATDAGGAPSVNDTANALLSGELELPDVGWEPKDPAPTESERPDVPVLLRTLLHCCGSRVQQRPRQHAQEQKDTLLGNAIVLGDGSDWMFCSHDCAAVAWVTWAAALSPGPRQQLPRAVKASKFIETFDHARISERCEHACGVGGALQAFPAAPAGPSNSSTRSMPMWLEAPANADAMHEFFEHASGSNDVFRVAARAVAMAGSAASMFEAAVKAGLCRDAWAGQATDARAAALQFAWQPFKAIAKAIWWEHVPMPADLEDEEAWREDLKYVAVPPASPGGGMQ